MKPDYISLAMLTYGYRENFEDEMEEERRLRTKLGAKRPSCWFQNLYGETIRCGEDSWNEAVSMPRESGCRGNFVEDQLVEEIDRKYSKKQPRRIRRSPRLQRRFLDRRTGEPRPGVRIIKAKAA